MMRSLYAGVTGLSTHQIRMDVIGNNIANVNTVGYKKATTTFADLYSQTVSPSAAPTADGTTGGVNPQQIGLGVTLNSITTVMTPGAASYTGNSLDIAIEGDGFFAVQTSTGTMYTRAGNLTLDTDGNLITSAGNYVQVIAPITSSETRWMVDELFTDTLFLPGGEIEGPPPGSIVHSGNISAELEGADGEYTFQYVADDPRLTPGNMSNYFRPLFESGSFDITATAGTIQTADLANAYIAEGNLDINIGGGDLPISFKGVPSTDPTAIEMYIGDVLIGDAAVNTTIGPPTLALDFGGGMELTVSIAAGQNISSAQLLSELNEMAEDFPDIAIEENGQWNLMMEGQIVEEDVKFDATTDLDGQISSGEMVFQTQGYGTFRLSLNSEDIKSSAGISEVFSRTGTELSFQLTVIEEPYPVYTSPTGTISPDALTTFTIDMDKYTNMSIDQNGAITAQIVEDTQVAIDGEMVQLSAGDKVVLGYIPLAIFNNPEGLEKIGENLYTVSSNSGEAILQMPGTGNAGSFSTSSLEMSNVDLAEEMVSMIVTQRGFQANSRIITTSDSMLEEIVNLKR